MNTATYSEELGDSGQRRKDTAMPLLRRRGDYSAAMPLPEGAAEHLRWDNPYLLELVRRYAQVESPLNTHTQWRDSHRSDLDLRYFRGDNCYVRQLSNYSCTLEESLVRYADYLRAFDARGLLGRLAEGGEFGCWTAEDGKGGLLSRDLLDSVNEISFLDRAWDLYGRRGATVLDVGAGYGRLGCRMVEAVEGLGRYYCVDAVPESTFVCSYYLGYRGVSRKAVTVPLDRLATLERTRIDLAVNIHGFSEMPYSAIGAWLEWLAARNVRHLFIISNTQDRLFSREHTVRGRNAAPLLWRCGYRRIAAEPIVRDPSLGDDLGVDDHFLLYELQR
ncbi:putative sugar O-methyltransferase [Streptomyces sp. ODS28]|uniref:putative sugar O-methyltransferase n=1 Tax=Streptomyces sp. ODS28 TaxID=3136688 RepID=UPI0031E766FE